MSSSYKAQSSLAIAAGFFALLLTLPLTSMADVDDLEGVETEENRVDEELEDSTIFPWAGEELYYSVRVNDAEAMRAGIRAGDIRYRDGHAYLPISGMARSRGFLDAVYPLNDQANTFLNPLTTRPLRSEKTFDENGKTRSYNVDYRHNTFTAQVERLRENRESRFSSAIPGETHDMLTWIYDLRRIGDLAIGDEYSFYIYDGWLLSRLDLEVVGREDVLTPMGWFKTWKLSFSRGIMNSRRVDNDNDDEDADEDAEPQPPTTSIRERGRHTGYLWLSRDENFLPVQFTIDTVLGAGQAVIIRYEPGEAQ